MTDANINPIGFLQEVCQKNSYAFPKYEEIKVSGPDHCKQFTVKCKFDVFETIGLARQKKQAKSMAAKNMIDLMKENKYLNNVKHENGLIPNTTKNDFNNAGEVGAMSENDVTVLKSKNPISAINEFCSKKSIPLPKFVEKNFAEGVFICECRLKGKTTYGQGCSKKAAKSEAARKMCVEFNVKYGIVGLNNVSRKGKTNDFLNGKNPVSALQEVCAKTYGLKNKLPVYDQMPSEMNSFVFKCTVGSISCEGRSANKKMAKNEAARLVLLHILDKNNRGNSVILNAAAMTLQTKVIPDADEDKEGENEKEDLSGTIKLEELKIES